MRVIDHFKSVPGVEDPAFHEYDEDFFQTAGVLLEADPRFEFLILHHKGARIDVGVSYAHVLHAQMGSDRGDVALLTSHPWSYIRYRDTPLGIYAYMALDMDIIHAGERADPPHIARISRTAFWRVSRKDFPDGVPEGMQFIEDPISKIENAGPHSILITLKCGSRLSLSLKEVPKRGMVSSAYLTYLQYPMLFSRKSQLRVKRYRWPRWPKERDFWHYLARLVENPIVHFRLMRNIDYIIELSRNPDKRPPIDKAKAMPELIGFEEKGQNTSGT